MADIPFAEPGYENLTAALCILDDEVSTCQVWDIYHTTTGFNGDEMIFYAFEGPTTLPERPEGKLFKYFDVNNDDVFTWTDWVYDIKMEEDVWEMRGEPMKLIREQTYWSEDFNSIQVTALLPQQTTDAQI